MDRKFRFSIHAWFSSGPVVDLFIHVFFVYLFIVVFIFLCVFIFVFKCMYCKGEMLKYTMQSTGKSLSQASDFSRGNLRHHTAQGLLPIEPGTAGSHNQNSCLAHAVACDVSMI